MMSAMRRHPRLRISARWCTQRARRVNPLHSRFQTRSRRREQHGGLTMKIWMTVGEAAEYAGVSRDTIYTACERSEIRHARIAGRRAIRLKPEWIDAWLERHARGAVAARASHHV
jgi:excisionase family DNA binding protein